MGDFNLRLELKAAVSSSLIGLVVLAAVFWCTSATAQPRPEDRIVFTVSNDREVAGWNFAQQLTEYLTECRKQRAECGEERSAADRARIAQGETITDLRAQVDRMNGTNLGFMCGCLVAAAAVIFLLGLVFVNIDQIVAAYRRSELKIPWSKIWALLSIPGSAFASMLGVWLALKIIAWLSDAQFDSTTKAGWYGIIALVTAIITTISAAIRWSDDEPRHR